MVNLMVSYCGMQDVLAPGLFHPNLGGGSFLFKTKIVGRLQSKFKQTPLIPILYSKTWVYKGIHYFFIKTVKHRMWILIRPASLM